MAAVFRDKANKRQSDARADKRFKRLERREGEACSGVAKILFAKYQ
jgi:hypothetical protein